MRDLPAPARVRWEVQMYVYSNSHALYKLTVAILLGLHARLQRSWALRRCEIWTTCRWMNFETTASMLTSSLLKILVKRCVLDESKESDRTYNLFCILYDELCCFWHLRQQIWVTVALLFLHVISSFSVLTRNEYILGIPMGPVSPMGFPWEWESSS